MKPRGNQPERATELTKFIAAQIRDLRRSQGITQQRLADVVCQSIAGFDRTTVMRIEIGQRERVTVDELLAIADALHVPHTRLLPAATEPDLPQRLRSIARELELAADLA